MSIHSGISSLINEIKSTKEYKELKLAKKNIDKYKDLKNSLETLQRKQMNLYKLKKSPKEMEEEAKKISRQFQSLSKNPEISKMVKAGENFTKIMNEVYQEISKQLYLEL